jgi:SAM-dependent methyltransferase
MTSETIWNEGVAAGYDASSTAMYAAEVLGPAVDFLAALAPGGRALELAIGTGRVAIPLSSRGLTVVGVDSSAAMLAEFHKKPGAETIDVVTGEMTTVAVPGSFDLVYVVYNAISCLLTQGDQVECFRNAARHLRPGGRFAVELFVPDLQRLQPGQTTIPFYAEDTRFGFDTYDVVNQRVTSHHYWVEGSVGSFHSPHRYIWPAELDLMAELAGLRLAERWADWNRAPFIAESRSHISVYDKPV